MRIKNTLLVYCVCVLLVPLFFLHAGNFGDELLELTEKHFELRESLKAMTPGSEKYQETYLEMLAVKRQIDKLLGTEPPPPSKVVIKSVVPGAGPVGTQVVLHGEGFCKKRPYCL